MLDLPIVAVITCRSWSECHLPRLPEGVDAVLLDGLEDPEDFDRFRRMVSLTLRKPVLGGVEALPDVREALRHVSRDNPPPEELSDRLAASFLRFADLEAIRALSQSRPFSLPAAEPIRADRRRFRVAYAQDEAFGGYFPDTLETLEALGAELVEFSPIRDESLPEAVDLVMIGCGYPDRHADALADNLSLIAALRCPRLPRASHLFRRGGDGLSGPYHDPRRPARPRRGHPAVRCGVVARSHPAHARDADPDPRRLAGAERDGRPGLSIGPLAAPARGTAARLPDAASAR